MSTVTEIECAIEKLPSEQQAEICRWINTRVPNAVPTSPVSVTTDFDTWLAQSTGLAKGILTTDNACRKLVVRTDCP